MRSLAIALITVGLAGCGAIWILPEADAIVMADAELSARGLDPGDRTHVVVTPLATLTLDGWDPDALVGYEYVSDPDADPDLGEASPYASPDGAEELQAAVDAAVPAGTRVLVIREWAHETEGLCRDQFLRNLQGRLDALGL